MSEKVCISSLAIIVVLLSFYLFVHVFVLHRSNWIFVFQVNKVIKTVFLTIIWIWTQQTRK